jgi:hypothetical protein
VSAVLVVLAGTAHAGVDWARGLVTADGLGIADRRAPSPAAAREPSRRAAEDAARAKLSIEVAKLPLAGGGTIKAKLGDQAVKARIDRAVAAALVVDFTPETDGSWRVTMGVPIEAIRQALVGPRAVAPTDAGVPALVVAGATVRPAVGVTVAGASAPTLWVSEVPAWAADAPRVKAKPGGGGAIQLAGAGAGAGPGTLYVVVVPK